MSTRITVTFLRAMVDRLNRACGYEVSGPGWSKDPDSYRLYQAYGGYGVHRLADDGGTWIRDLTGGCYSARECERFLSGMLARLGG